MEVDRGMMVMFCLFILRYRIYVYMIVYIDVCFFSLKFFVRL